MGPWHRPALLVAPLGMPASALVQLGGLPPAAAASLAGPNSASGCSQDVCINITGGGTDVTDWSTSATAPGFVCTYVYRNSLERTSTRAH